MKNDQYYFYVRRLHIIYTQVKEFAFLYHFRDKAMASVFINDSSIVILL
jgi:hypothetical protein